MIVTDIYTQDLLFRPALEIHIPVIQGKIPLWETFYFDIMASLRALRLDIPLSYTPEILYKHLETYFFPDYNDNAFLTLVFGRVQDKSNHELAQTGLAVQKSKSFYNHPIVLGMWKEELISTSLYSGYSLYNSIIDTIKVYKEEQGVDDFILLNNSKSIARTIIGSLFLVQKDNRILTPALAQGAIKETLRLNIISYLQSIGYEVEETVLKPYQIQQSQEVFVVSNAQLLNPVEQFLNKKFPIDIGKNIQAKWLPSLV